MSRGGDSSKLIKVLISAGADVNARTTGPNGYTPLTIAASNGYESIVSLLLDTPNIEIDKPRKTPKNPETDGMTALHCAAWTSQEAMLRLLKDWQRLLQVRGF